MDIDGKKTNTAFRMVGRWWEYVIVAVLLLAIVFLFGQAWKLFAGLQKEVAAALIAGATTIIVSVLSVSVARYYERKRVIEQEIRQKKIPMYNEFVEFWFNFLMSEKIASRKITDKEMMKFFNQFTQKLMVWGSDEVVRQWSLYRRSFSDIQSELDTSEAMFGFEKLLLAIRKDTGHKNNGIMRGDLLGFS